MSADVGREFGRELTRLSTGLSDAKRIIRDLLATRPAMAGWTNDEHQEAIDNAVEFLGDETLR